LTMVRAQPAKSGNVEAAKKLLEEALRGKVPRTRRPTKTEGIQELKPQIEALRKKGYSWAEIATLLKDAGFGNKDTIRYAISGDKAKKQAGADEQQELRPEAKKVGVGAGGVESDPAATSQPTVGGNEMAKAEPVEKEQRGEHAAQRRATWTP
jgi:DNA-binding transcriptional MerR regulator